MNEKPFIQRLIHNYLHSDLTLTLSLGHLRLRFRPLSYDLIVIFSVIIRHIYGRVPADMVVVDVGAHIGTFSLQSTRAGALNVFAYEPEQKNFELLRENLAINGLEGKIHAFKQAVWSRDERKTLFVAKGSAFHSFYPGDDGIGRVEPTVCVGINTILDRLNHPVLLKIDAEGSEYEIIPHISDVNIAKIRRIELEYHLGNRPREIAFHSLLEWFLQKGFIVHKRQGINVISAVKK